MNPTCIRSVPFFTAATPLARPIADSTHEIASIAFVITRLELASGVVGEAYLLAFHYSPRAIAGALADIAALARGFEVSATGEFLRAYERESEYFGLAGLHRWAQGAVNIAMWDAWGRALGQPVWKLFGTHRERIPAYGSGGWLSYSVDELLAEAAAYVRRGFRAVKVKVGSPQLERDMERLTRLRESVGPHVDLMMDANQGMTVATASRLAEAVRDLRITWFEEPLPHTDFDGYADLRRQSSLSLAMGEREFDTVALREGLAAAASISGNPTSCAWAAWSRGAPPPPWPTPTTFPCCRTTTRSTTSPS